MFYVDAINEINALGIEVEELKKRLTEFEDWKGDSSVVTSDEEFNALTDEKKKNRVNYKIKALKQRIDTLNTKIEDLKAVHVNTLIETKNKLGECKVHAIINAKGGTGKSTLTASIAWTLAQMGYNVLAIDSDSQSSLTQLLNVFAEDDEEELLNLRDIYDYFTTNEPNKWEAIQQVIVRPKYEKYVLNANTGKLEPITYEFGFDLIPADIGLADTEINITRSNAGGLLLYRVIDVIKKNSNYDFILIDCPPALTTLAANAITASTDGVIVPINLSPMVLRSTRNLLSTVSRIQAYFKGSNLNHKGVLGLIKNEYTKNRKITKSLDDVVKEFFPIYAFNAVIPSRSACANAEFEGQLFAQVPSIQKEGFFTDLANEIIEQDILRADETDTPTIGDIKIDERRLRINVRK